MAQSSKMSVIKGTWLPRTNSTYW